MFESESSTNFLADRRGKLIDRAEAAGIDWEPQIADLPEEDEGLIVVALATLLELDIRDVLDQDKTLDEIGRERDVMLRAQQISHETDLRG
jgi:hypothetical protein